MHILIFKTDIKTEEAYQEVGQLLSDHPLINNWNIDKEDIGNVLRIGSRVNNGSEIISTITQAVFL